MPTKKTKVILSLVITTTFLIIACSKSNTDASREDLVAKYLNLPVNPFNYANPSMPAYLLAPPIQGQINTPADNEITDFGATLGRVYFTINHFLKIELYHVPVVTNRKMRFQILKY